MKPKLNLENLANHEVDDILYRIVPLHYGQAIQFYSCFISHSTKAQEFADRLHADLQSKGVRRWFAPLSVPGDGKLRAPLCVRPSAVRIFLNCTGTLWMPAKK